MEEPKIPDVEELRLACLQELDILDTPAEPVYDRITEVVSEVLDIPIALISLVDEQRQWFKSRVGLDAAETGRDVSFCGHVVFSNDELLIEDTLEDARFADNPLVLDGPKIRFYAGMPLTVSRGITLGSLCVIDTRPRQLTDQQQAFLRKMSQVVIEIFNHERMALKDHLTGVFNRRMFENLGNKLIAENKRSQTVFSLITFDIDHFKAINDRQGHAMGDKVLTIIATGISAAMREQDYLFRTGGEEFVILAPAASLQQATDYAERLRLGLATQRFSTKQHEVQVTASFGVGEYDASDESLHALLKRCDSALYDAKAAGRNCVMVSRVDQHQQVDNVRYSAIR